MKKQLRKIMFHINSLGKGGAERVVSLLADEFVKSETEVVIATEWYSEDEYELNPKVKRVHVGLDETQEKASRLQKQWLRIVHLRKAIRQEKPDVVLSFCVKANYRAMMASMGTRIPVIVSVRNDPQKDYTGKINTLMNHLFLNRAAGCVFQTEEARNFFNKKLQKKSVIICNPVNEKYLQAERRKPEKKIVCVGRLVAQKNQMLLVCAFEKIIKKYPEYHLYLYGDGSDDACKEELLAYAENHHLTERIHFMGLSSTLETDIADAAMFVLPSNYEGMPNALMEAMAMGLPVISTDCPCGGSRYWIEHGETGQLVPVGDEDALAQAMEFYILHPDKADEYGEKAKNRLQDATVEKVFLRWKEYILEVSNRCAEYVVLFQKRILRRNS